MKPLPQYFELIGQVWLLVTILFLAGKDATSYRLKDHNRAASSLQASRINRWHRDGVCLWVLITLPVFYFISPWQAVWSVLIRASVWDISFNHWAGLPKRYLGGSAWFDRLFVKVFGTYGAVRKSLAFACILVLSNLLTTFFHNLYNTLLWN